MPESFAARVTLILICLHWMMSPSVARAQPCQEIQRPSARSSDFPLDIRLGLRAFVGWTKLRGESRFADATFKTRPVPALGASVGFVSAKNFFQWRGGLQFDASYMTKGTRIAENGEEIASLNLRYYDLALLARGERVIGAGLTIYLLGGPRLGILRDATYVISGGEMDVTEETQDRDWGILAGIGAAWAIHPSHHLTFDVRTDIGVKTTDASVNDNDFKNLAISLSLGYQWSYPPRPAKAAVPCPES